MIDKPPAKQANERAAQDLRKKKEGPEFQWKLVGYADGLTLTLLKCIEKQDAEAQMARLIKDHYYQGLAIYAIDAKVPPPPRSAAKKKARKSAKAARSKATSAKAKTKAKPATKKKATAKTKPRTLKKQPAPKKKTAGTAKRNLAGKKARASSAKTTSKRGPK